MRRDAATKARPSSVTARPRRVRTTRRAPRCFSSSATLRLTVASGAAQSPRGSREAACLDHREQHRHCLEPVHLILPDMRGKLPGLQGTPPVVDIIAFTSPRGRRCPLCPTIPEERVMPQLRRRTFVSVLPLGLLGGGLIGGTPAPALTAAPGGRQHDRPA